MTENKDALHQHYAGMRQDLLSAIDGLNDERMVEATIDGWSVKDHLAHIALWDDIRASEVARISAGHDSAWRMTAEQDASLNAMAYDLRRSLSLSQAKWEFSTSVQRLNDAISTATPRGLDASLYGEAGLRSTHETQHASWIKRWRREKGY